MSSQHKSLNRKNLDSENFETKVKFYAEFRRFTFSKNICAKYDDFRELLIATFHLEGIPITICYTDPIHEDLLPINNNENYAKALSVIKENSALFRILLQRLEEDPGQIIGYGNTLSAQKRKNRLSQYLLNVPNYLLSAGTGLTSDILGLHASPLLPPQIGTFLQNQNQQPYAKTIGHHTVNGPPNLLRHQERLLTLNTSKPGRNARYSLPPYTLDFENYKSVHETNNHIRDHQIPTPLSNISTLLKITQKKDAKKFAPPSILPPIADISDVESSKFSNNEDPEESLKNNDSNLNRSDWNKEKKSHKGILNNSSSTHLNTLSTNKNGLRPLIGGPCDFRTVSSIIDVDLVPETQRRVRLVKPSSKSSKNGIIDNRPLGFYIKEGYTVQITSTGLERVTGIFISRLIAGGIAAGTGLLAVGDEILEVNGITVDGKTLDQVTDMMIANAHDLVITVKPADQSNTLMKCRRKTKEPLSTAPKLLSNGHVTNQSQQTNSLRHSNQRHPNGYHDDDPSLFQQMNNSQGCLVHPPEHSRSSSNATSSVSSDYGTPPSPHSVSATNYITQQHRALTSETKIGDISNDSEYLSSALDKSYSLSSNLHRYLKLEDCNKTNNLASPNNLACHITTSLDDYESTSSTSNTIDLVSTGDSSSHKYLNGNATFTSQQFIKAPPIPPRPSRRIKKNLAPRLTNSMYVVPSSIHNTTDHVVFDSSSPPPPPHLPRVSNNFPTPPPRRMPSINLKTLNLSATKDDSVHYSIPYKNVHVKTAKDFYSDDVESLFEKIDLTSNGNLCNRSSSKKSPAPKPPHVCSKI